MSKSFRRNFQTVRLSGTKPSKHGGSIVSTGLRDADELLNGGQPLPSILCLQEDRFHNQTLLKYWCAEALVQDQELVVVVSTTNSHSNDRHTAFLTQLPGLMGGSTTTKEGSVATTQLDPLVEEDDHDKSDDHLVVAWQYRKDVQQQLSGNLKPSTAVRNDTTFSHSYNLQQTLSKDYTDKARVCTVEDKDGFQLFRALVQEVLSTIETKKEKKQVTRLVLTSAISVTALAVAIPLLMNYLQRHELPVVVFLSLDDVVGTDNHQAMMRLKRCCDVVLTIESFVNRIHYPPPPEFQKLQALLHVSRIATYTGPHFGSFTVSKRPISDIYGLRRDRRKLHIQLLHIPPAESSGLRATSCATSVGDSPLDF